MNRLPHIALLGAVTLLLTATCAKEFPDLPDLLLAGDEPLFRILETRTAKYDDQNIRLSIDFEHRYPELTPEQQQRISWINIRRDHPAEPKFNIANNLRVEQPVFDDVLPAATRQACYTFRFVTTFFEPEFSRPTQVCVDL